MFGDVVWWVGGCGVWWVVVRGSGRRTVYVRSTRRVGGRGGASGLESVGKWGEEAGRWVLGGGWGGRVVRTLQKRRVQVPRLQFARRANTPLRADDLAQHFGQKGPDAPTNVNRNLFVIQFPGIAHFFFSLFLFH